MRDETLKEVYKALVVYVVEDRVPQEVCGAFLWSGRDLKEGRIGLSMAK